MRHFAIEWWLNGRQRVCRQRLSCIPIIIVNNKRRNDCIICSLLCQTDDASSHTHSHTYTLTHTHTHHTMITSFPMMMMRRRRRNSLLLLLLLLIVLGFLSRVTTAYQPGGIPSDVVSKKKKWSVWNEPDEEEALPPTVADSYLHSISSSYNNNNNNGMRGKSQQQMDRIGYTRLVG